jgi:N utilization substance protein A
MIIIDNFLQVTAQIETERGVSKDVLISAIEQALVSACRRRFSEEAVLEATVDPDTGESHIYEVKQVVKSVENPILEVTEAEAKKLGFSAKAGEEIRIEYVPEDLGRTAAQAAKQVIIQRIREAEKNAIFRDFKDRIGHIVIGTVQRVENQNYLINLGRAEAILAYRDQIPGERFMPKEKVRVYIVDLDRSAKGSLIHISRSHPGFLQELMTQEIPEIQDGIIEIMAVSRDPGKRAKVAVKSNSPSIGAVGTCVGHMGTRIQAVTKELGREKIDILEWSDDPKTFIAHALKPAKINSITITDEAEKTATVHVPADQLSLAIGKGGVNVRLSVRLTGWKLDVVSDGEGTSSFSLGSSDSAPSASRPEGLSLADRLKLDRQQMEEEASASSEEA